MLSLPEEPKPVPIDKMTPQQLDVALQRLEQERTKLVSKVSEMGQESREHQLVLDVFAKVEPTRRCFRLVGGVLVEQTVAAVQPALAENKKNIDAFLLKCDDLLKERSDQAKAVTARIAKLESKEPSRKSSANTNSIMGNTRSSGSSGVLV